MVIINLVPVAAGGGLQNAISFLTEFYKCSCIDNSKFIFIVRTGSALEELCSIHNIKYESVKLNSVIDRLRFETIIVRKIVARYSPKVIFTLFGNPPVFTPSKVKKVSGFARSNIIEQRSEFWSFLPTIEYFKKRMTDELIRVLFKRSDVIIVETERLLRLAESSRTFGNSKIRCVQMSPSAAFDNLKSASEMDIQDPIGVKKIAYIAGPHPNKRIEKLAELFYWINRFEQEYRLVVTFNESSDYATVIKDSFNQYGVLDYVDFVGPISPDMVPVFLADKCAVVNFSMLESFSNNWVEAWKFRKLLICRNDPYAVDSCGDAAFYLDLRSMRACAMELHRIFESEELYGGFLEKGDKMLKSLPTSSEKFKKYMDIINEFC